MTIGISVFVYGSAADGMLENAREAYTQGRYAEAFEIWDRLYAEGYTDPDILINMGNALAMEGRIPEARMAYEKALRFRPLDKMLVAAINQLHANVGNRVEPADEFFLVRWYRMVVVMLRPSIWALLGLLVLLSGVAGYLTTVNNKLRVPLFFSRRFGTLIITGAVLLCVAMLSYRSIYRMNEAVVFTACEIYQGPSAQSPLLRTISAGEKVKLQDRIAGWKKVRLLNYDEGWLKEECIEVIDPR